MKTLGMICVLLVAVALAGVVWAEGYSQTFGLGDGNVVVSNSQANSSWVTVSVAIRYDVSSTGTAEVRRVSQGVNTVLGWCTFTNVTSLVWVPDSSYSFGYGDALVIKTSVSNGVLQVTRRGD